MREILFRAKNYGNEWVYGLLGYCNFNLGVEKAIYVVNEYRSIMPDRIIPETVGQFTGLIDKNGKRIFEGDIVSPRNAITNYQVMWGNCGFVIKGEYGLEICPTQNAINFLEVEVIGNIYDNP